MNGLLWIANTGAPWRDLPTHYGSWKTIASRFYRWTRSGLWQRVLAALQQQADANGQLDWTTHHVDSTIIRAHQHAAGARGGRAGEALGRSPGGFTTKLRIRVEGQGLPLVLHVTAGERHDSPEFVSLVEGGRIKRGGRGRPRSRPHRVAGDKSYNSRTIRKYSRQHGIKAIIPRTSNQRRLPQFDREGYRERNRVERFINRLKQFRRVATRYEKRAIQYLAIVTIAAIMSWL